MTTTEPIYGLAMASIIIALSLAFALAMYLHRLWANRWRRATATFPDGSTTSIRVRYFGRSGWLAHPDDRARWYAAERVELRGGKVVRGRLTQAEIIEHLEARP